MQGPPTAPTDQAEAPIATETVSMRNNPTPTMKAEAPIPTETDVSMSNGPTMKAETPTATETVSMRNDPNMKAEAPILATESVSMSNSPNMKAEASISMETVSNGNEPHLIDDTVPLHRKATKRGELLVSQDEDNPVRKKPRLEEPLPTTIDEVARNTASPDISVGLPPPAVDNDDVDANADPLTDSQPNDKATRATSRWTTDEDAELTRVQLQIPQRRSGARSTRQIGA
jgi:hypothetical protein